MQLTTTDLAKITLSVLASFGGGGAIVAYFSNWLGKMWAERFMQKEKARYEKELEDFKAQLNRESDRTTQTLREKLSLYKEAIPPLVDLIARYQLTPADVTPAVILEFEKKRLATSAMLGMFAAVPVFDAYNSLIDYIFNCLEGKQLFAFAEFRVLGYKMMSEIREDVGISGGELVYRGNR
jgi:hypothetical protein